MILVTGATGNMGRHLVRSLHRQGAAVRAVSRDAAKARALLPADVEIAEGDLRDPGFLERVCRGAEAVFTLLEAGDPRDVVKAAVDARRIVLVTSLLAETLPDGFVGQLSLDAEQAVRDSGARWTVLRPWEFTTNTLAWADEVRAAGVVRKPAAGQPSPVVDPADVADVAALALLDGDGTHAGQTYALTGPTLLTPYDKVAVLGAALGRGLSFEENGTPEQLAAIRETPDQVSEGFGVCFMTSPGVLPTIADVLGRPPRDYAQWVADNVPAFR